MAKLGKPLPPKRKGREIAIVSVLSDRRMGDEANSNASKTLPSILCNFFHGFEFLQRKNSAKLHFCSTSTAVQRQRLIIFSGILRRVSVSIFKISK
jgi:hypothetical protein